MKIACGYLGAFGDLRVCDMKRAADILLGRTNVWRRGR
jgi:hypothetical protein